MLESQTLGTWPGRTDYCGMPYSGKDGREFRWLDYVRMALPEDGLWYPRRSVIEATKQCILADGYQDSRKRSSGTSNSRGSTESRMMRRMAEKIKIAIQDGTLDRQWLKGCEHDPMLQLLRWHVAWGEGGIARAGRARAAVLDSSWSYQPRQRVFAIDPEVLEVWRDRARSIQRVWRIP